MHLIFQRYILDHLAAQPQREPGAPRLLNLSRFHSCYPCPAMSLSCACYDLYKNMLLIPLTCTAGTSVQKYL